MKKNLRFSEALNARIATLDLKLYNLSLKPRSSER